MEIPAYIKALLRPNGAKPAGRRAWGIDLQAIWLPFFKATNTVGDTAIAAEALGAPLRLAYDTDGSVKFSKTGRPVIKVVKELAEAVKLVRENFTAGLVSFANGVAMENPEGFKAQGEAAAKAGLPIIARDRTALEQALAVLALAQAQAQAIKEVVRPKTAKAEAAAKAAAKAEAEAAAEPTPKRKRKAELLRTAAEGLKQEAEAPAEVPAEAPAPELVAVS